MERIDYQKLKKIAFLAGEKIMEVYQREDFSTITDFKADDSPLTLADKESHIVISTMLAEAFPDIPVLSEEGKTIPFNERENWGKFWCVDPLDGTKEFINRNGQFTVNIALIDNGKPVVGIIYIPVTNVFYYGNVGVEAIKEDEKGISDLSTLKRTRELIAVGSKSHSAPEEKELLEKMGVKDVVSKGSSLKFCMVAEGKADVYYRHGPTMEWDTAAGQAIVEAAGGVVLDSDQSPFVYNKQNLLNGSFYCLSNKELINLL
jgi:3'(2'), 5'-bisphosphate nucleotidase